MKRVVFLLLAMCVSAAGTWAAAPAASAPAKPWLRAGTKAGEEITGPDGGEMVWVPPGEFMMGADDLYDWCKPIHRVRITKGFWLAKHEVTNADVWRQLLFPCPLPHE